MKVKANGILSSYWTCDGPFVVTCLPGDGTLVPKHVAVDT